MKWSIILMIIFLFGVAAIGVNQFIVGTDATSLVLHNYLPIVLGALGLTLIVVVAVSKV